MELPGGLASDRVSAFGALIAEIARAEMPRPPYLAPALLFAERAVQARLGMPVAAPGEILVQDYQSVEYNGAFPLDTALQATSSAAENGSATEFRMEIAGHARLTTAVRRLPRGDLAKIRPTQFRNFGALGDLAAAGPHSISRAQVGRYLALSGDGNPIHADTALAQSLGLAQPVVPGLLLVSMIQPVCEQALPDARLRSLKARFMAPLCLGAPFQIALQSRGEAPEGGARARAYLAENGRALAICDLQFG